MVELIDYFGNDLMIVNAARVSFGKEKKVFDEKDAKLIDYLILHKHTAPFRHPQFQFRITCPIYVERQLFKHQIGLSANSISGRYVDFSDSYTIITEWRKQSTSSKQGSEGLIEEQFAASEIEAGIIGYCKTAYQKLIELGVSKEQARTILPLNLNTTFIWTGSLLSFLHLWDLRLKPDTQSETREIAQQMLDLVKSIEGNPFEQTIKSITKNGKSS
jgi:thymidylate synthase (FAD)